MSEDSFRVFGLICHSALVIFLVYNRLLNIFTSMSETHLPDISKSGNRNSCYSQPALSTDFPISANEDSVLGQLNPKTLVILGFFTFSSTL